MQRWWSHVFMVALFGLPACGASVGVAVCGDWWCVGGPVVLGAQAGCVGCDFPTSLAAADFDLDGNQDLAGGGSGDGAVAVAFGDGAGGFTSSYRVTVGIGESSDFVRTGLFDGGTEHDLAAFDAAKAELRVFLGGGDGSFLASGAPQVLGTSAIRDVAVGAVNGDALSDLVVLFSNGTMGVFLGQNAGGFAPSTGSPVPLGVDGYRLALAHLDAVGGLDVVVLDRANGTLSTWLGSGNGSFVGAGAPIAAGARPAALDTGALDRSVGDDVVVVDEDDGMVRVFLSNGDGTFTASPQGPLPPPQGGGLAVRIVPSLSDPTAPGDLAVAYAADLLGTAWIVGRANWGGGVFGPASAPVFVGAAYDVLVVDLNGDAFADLAVARGAPGLVGIALGGTRER